MFKKEEYQQWTTGDYRINLQKTAPEGERETYTGKTVRFFSIFLTKILARTNLTPNNITTISVLIFLSGMSLFIFPNYNLHILGAVLVYLSIIFDACDGEIARLKGNKSGIGSIYIEPLSHDIQYALMFIPLTLGVYLVRSNIIIVYIGFFGTVFKLLTRFITFRYLKMKKILEIKGKTNNKKIKTIDNSFAEKNFIKRLYHFLNRDIFSSVGMAFPLLFFASINRIDWFICFYSFGFFAIFLLHFANQLIYILKLSK